MAIQNLDVIQDIIKKGRQQGKTDDQLVELISKSKVTDPNVATRIQQLRVGGTNSAKILNDLSALRVNTVQGEEEMKTKGVLGKVADFVGAEKLGRRIGYAAAQIDPQQRQNIETVRQLQGQDAARELQTGGVSDTQALASLALTASNVGIPGVAGALSKAGTAGKIAMGTGLGAGFGALGSIEDTGDLSEVGQGAVLGGLLGGAIPTVGAAGRLLFKSLPKKTLSIIYGKKPEVIDELVKNPTATLRGMKGGDALLIESTKNIRKQAQNLNKMLSKQYGEKFQNLGLTNFNVTESPVDISKNISGILKQFGAKVGKEGLDLSTSQIKPEHHDRVKQAWNIIKSVDDTSVENLNQIKQAISNLTDFETLQGSKSIGVLKKMSSYIDDLITDPERGGVAELRVLNREFQDKKRFLKNVQDLLKIKKEDFVIADVDKTYRALNTLFNKNKGLAKDFLTEFETMADDSFKMVPAVNKFQNSVKDVLSEVAGVNLAEAQTNQTFWAVISAIIDPEVTFTAIGKTAQFKQQAKQKIANAFAKLGPDEVKGVGFWMQESGFTPNQIKKILSTLGQGAKFQFIQSLQSNNSGIDL